MDFVPRTSDHKSSQENVSDKHQSTQVTKAKDWRPRGRGRGTQVARRLDCTPEKGRQRPLGRSCVRPADEPRAVGTCGQSAAPEVLSGSPRGRGGRRREGADGTAYGLGGFLSVYSFKLKTEKSGIQNNSIDGLHRNDRPEKSYCIREKCPRKLSGLQQKIRNQTITETVTWAWRNHGE